MAQSLAPWKLEAPGSILFRKNKGTDDSVWALNSLPVESHEAIHFSYVLPNIRKCHKNGLARCQVATNGHGRLNWWFFPLIC